MEKKDFDKKKQENSLNKIVSKRLIFVVLILVSISFSLFAKNDDNKTKNQLFAVKTKYFEIIYPQECKKSAEILFENADKIYLEVADQYGLTPSFSMPIVLTPATDSFNAFWTSAPYNHIVIYDTSFSISSDLAVFSETLIQTFRHELTHAVTYNMKSPFWNAVSTIFGDCITPASLWISSGMAEGATVTSESAAGEGRLNDEFAKHMVKQAKIENQFPSYYDVLGSRDKYPAGSFYYFNGAFHQWLQQKFGMEKYAEFWYKLVNLKALTVGIAFNKVYGIKLKDAWKEFEESYPVPEIPSNPLETGLIQDFFNSQNDCFSKQNKTGFYINSLTQSQNAIAWLDNYGGRVFYVSRTDLQNKIHKSDIEIKPKMLFQLKNAQSISLSDDGKFLTVSYFSENSNGEKSRTKIYNIDTKKFFTVKTKSIKDSAIIKNQEKYFLVSTKYTSPANSIYIEEIALNDSGDIKSTEFFVQIDLPLNVNVSNFIQTKEDEFAFIQKNKLNYSIVTYSFTKGEFTQYPLPEEKMKIRSLSYDKEENAFYYSWVYPGTMPRIGQFKLDEKKYTLSGSFCDKSGDKSDAGDTADAGDAGDISGGVFNPVSFDREIVFIGQFYQFSKIMKIPSVKDYFQTTGKTEYFCKNDNSVEVKLTDDKTILQFENKDYEHKYNSMTAASKTSYENSAENIPEKKFIPFKYYLQGVFIPFTSFVPDNFGCNAGLTELSGYSLGLTFITADPWTDGSTSLYTSTFGWDIFHNSFGFEFTGQNATISNLFQMNWDLKTEIDEKGWKNSSALLTFQMNLEIGNNSSLTFANQTGAKIGRQNNLQNLLNSETKKIYNSIYSENKNYYSLSDAFSATFSSIRKAGSGRYEKKGGAYTLGLGYRYDSDLGLSPLEYVNAIQIEQNLKFYIPHLMPYSSVYGKTTNFPAKIAFSVFPIEPEYLKKTNYTDSGKSFLDMKCEVILFAAEIQKAIPVLQAVYMNDFAVSAGYNSSLATGKKRTLSNLEDYGNFASTIKQFFQGECYYLDTVYIKGSWAITPNLGGLAKSSLKTTLYLQAACSLRKSFLQKNKNPFIFDIGFSSTF
ncbi:MAG: hypothetical protein MR739_04795 [Spirochaetia bacterium]|nr:hypothetical protein [Spirochaetia bacterium]